jgi:sortase (surface protein transpeptidase)
VEAGQVVDTATATGVGVSGGVSARSGPSTVAVPTANAPPAAVGSGGPGSGDDGFPVGGVQTGSGLAPGGRLDAAPAMIGILAAMAAFTLALGLGVRRSRLLGGTALVMVVAAVVAASLPGGGTAPSGAPAATAIGHRARTTPVLPPSNHVPLAHTGMRVRVPAIGVAADVVSLGLNSDSTLQVPTNATDAGWWNGGTAPGWRGAAVIVGHVNWGGDDGVFSRLDEILPGQSALVTRNGVTYRFRVTSTAVYPKVSFPTDLVYGPLPHPGLRLITCTGRFDPSTGHYDDNLIVFARLTARTGPGTARTL